MRVPSDVLERVRGVMVVAALVGCTSEPAAALLVVPETPVIVAVSEPVDPVSYDASGESARLARLDLEEQGASTQRSVRVASIANAQRAARQRAEQLAWQHVSRACGRG